MSTATAVSLSVRMIEITPDLARKWLDKRPDYQRKIDQKQVDKLAMAIAKKEWRENGATIVFNEQDELLDGQHRLSAIAQSGEVVRSLVVRDVSKEEATFQTIGDEKPRKLVDFVKTNNAACVSSVARTYWNLLNGGTLTSQAVPPFADVLKLVRKYGDEISDMVYPVYAAGRELRQLSFCVFLVFFHSKIRPVSNPERLAKFFTRVGDGLELTANDPVYRLRKRFYEQANGVQMKRSTAHALILKALYLYLDEKPCTTLRFEPEREEFPALRGWKSPKSE